MKKILHIATVTAFLFLSISPVPGVAFDVNVVQGNATVTTNGNTVTITATGKAILQGNTSIPAGFTVNVIQGINDILLRDSTGSATSILGSLFSNGNIILINTMGIYIGRSANINVGGLIASTLDMKNDLFMNGNYQFEKVPGLDPAEILNKANIKIANGGYIVLLADRVVNKGTITAYMGTVALGSGQEATLSFDQGGLINLVINEGLAQELIGKNGKSKAQIVNNGRVYADGGKIQMTAQLLQTALQQIVNNTGIIEASDVVDHGGLVELTSSGAIDNTGTIKAGTLKEQGETLHSTGTLDVGHGYFNNLDGAINIAGNISGTIADVDDINFIGNVTLTGDTTLDADSGATGTQGEIVMNGNSLTGGGFNLTLTAGVDDVLDGAITGVNLLTLNSSTMNPVTFTSTSAASGSFSVNTLQTNDPASFSRDEVDGLGNQLIFSVSDAVGGLQYMGTSGNYKLANNINAAETSSWNSGAGFTPIGNNSTPFTGTFDGNNYTISHLFIHLPSTTGVGLFGATSGALIENVGLINVNITGQSSVGGLVGSNAGSIVNSYTTGALIGSGSYLGGLAGQNSSSIDNSYATDTVSGAGSSAFVGGLVGINYGSINNSYAAGSVSTGGGGAYNPVGGLVGQDTGSITNSYATGSVSGNNRVGGLVGRMLSGGSITDSFATGVVNAVGSGVNSVGGLVGFIKATAGSISDSYATGSVSTASGSSSVGGLIGYTEISNIINSYATGSVNAGSGSSLVGGFIGDIPYGYSGLTNDWWYNSLSNGVGNNGSSTITGQWQKAGSANDFFDPSQSVYNGSHAWDLNGLWSAGGSSYPTLVWQGMNNGSFIGGTSTVPFLINNVNQLQFMNYEPGDSFQLASDIDASSTVSWNSGAGFTPIGNNTVRFTGTFNGNNYTISNLFIDLPSTDGVGLFGETVPGTTIENVGLLNVNITGHNGVGGIGGYNSSNIDNSYVTGSVNGSNYVGGLAGHNFSDTIDNSYATASVSGNNSVGGLVGFNPGASITNSYATGTVTGSGSEVGGLVGFNFNSGSISDSYATGTVVGAGSYVGGLAGFNYISSTIDNSYATGSVSGGNNVGGLVGYNSSSSSITNSYATGTVSAGSNGGGLAGANDSSTITNSYYTDSNNQNGLGTYDSNGAADFYSPFNPVYAIGSVGGWDIFTPAWDTYTDELPHLHWEDHSGNATPYWLGTTSTDFAAASNWSNNAVPGIGSTVIIFNGSNDPVLNGTAALANLLVGSGTFTQNGALTVSGNYIQAGGGYDQNADLSVGGSFLQNGGTFNSDPSRAFSVGNNFSLNGGTFSRFTGSGSSGDPYLIYDIYGLQGVQGFLSSDFALHNDIDASATSNWNSGAGFTPLGNGDTSFTGTFNGNNYTISNLFINLPSTNYVGLFGQALGASIENVGLTNVNITGDVGVGGLAGFNVNSSISNSYVTGNVTADSSSFYVGGLVGYNTGSSSIDNSYAAVNVIGSGYYAGGLVGINNASSIDNSYATGSVSGDSNYVGGLVGFNENSGSISNSYSTDSVSGGFSVGGLAGGNYDANITNSYAIGSVSGADHVGGLVGYNRNSSSIDNSYATGSVNGGNNAGGLVGDNDSSSITNSYTIGSVSGSSQAGGLTGEDNSGSYTNDFYDTGIFAGNGTGNNGTPVGISGVPDSGPGSMQDMNTFINAGWDLNGLWKIDTSNNSYPHLLWQDMGDGSAFIGGSSAHPFQVSNVNELQFMNYSLNDSFKLTSNVDASAASGWNAGTGFAPIGNSSTPFTGTFDGNNYTISGLFIDLPATDDVGLFGYTSGATIKNIGLLNVNITGQNSVGGLVGYNNNSSSIDNSYAAGSVSGNGNDVGGLAGYNNSSSITNSYATGSVSGSVNFVGGLVGYNNNSSSIDNSYATGSVSGNGSYVGGLAGINYFSSNVSNSYATGSVSGSGSLVGGLVGYNRSGSIDNSYATGSVNGGGSLVGGLVGYNNSVIDNSYATGSVSGSGGYVGGLVGLGPGAITNSFYTDPNNQNGLGIFESSGSSAFYSIFHPVYNGTSPWDFTNTWVAVSNTYPVLRFNYVAPVVSQPPSSSSSGSSSPLSPQQQGTLFAGLPSEMTGHGFYSPQNITISIPALTQVSPVTIVDNSQQAVPASGSVQVEQSSPAPYGGNWMNAKNNNGIGQWNNGLEGDQAVEDPSGGVEIVSSPLGSGIQ